jgi:hypothetical protein
MTIGTKQRNKSTDFLTVNICAAQQEAITYLRCKGIPNDEIRFFRKTFKQEKGFEPNPTASFKQEFNRFASSQRWSNQEKRKARVDLIRDEIIQHFLPDGIRISAEQDDDEGYVHLDEGQALEVFQAMCRKVGKPVPSSIHQCLRELKAAPYVNIWDFVDCYRTGTRIQTFWNWFEFKDYTMEGRKMDMQVAKNNEFLAPLLQDLVRGPGAVDPCRVRDELVATRLAEEAQRRRQKAERQNLATMSRPNLNRALSPSVFDQSLSPPRSPTPPSEPATPSMKNEYDNGNCPQIKCEPSTARSSSSSNLAVLPSTPPTNYSDADCSNSNYGSDHFDDAMLADLSESDYGFDQFDEVMLEEMKSQSMVPSPFVSRLTIPGPTTLAGPFVTPFATPRETPHATPAPIKQEIKIVYSEPAAVTPTPQSSIPLIDLTQNDDVPNNSSAARIGRSTVRVSQGKRPRSSSPRVVVSAKRTRSSAKYEYAPYTELPKTQTTIQSFFAPSQVRA